MKMTPVDWKPHPDTRPAKDDRAEAIRTAQAAGPQITIPVPAAGAKADFPSLTGDTMRGLGPEHDGLAKAEQTVMTPTPQTAPIPTPPRKRPS